MGLKERIEKKFSKQIEAHVINICSGKLSTEIENEIDNLVSFRASWGITHFPNDFLLNSGENENLEEIRDILLDYLDTALNDELGNIIGLEQERF